MLDVRCASSIQHRASSIQPLRRPGLGGLKAENPPKPLGHPSGSNCAKIDHSRAIKNALARRPQAEKVARAILGIRLDRGLSWSSSPKFPPLSERRFWLTGNAQ